MIRRGGLDGLPWVRMGGGLGPREEREEQGRRPTIKAHPATPHHTRPYGNGISPGRMERGEQSALYNWCTGDSLNSARA